MSSEARAGVAVVVTIPIPTSPPRIPRHVVRMRRCSQKNGRRIRGAGANAEISANNRELGDVDVKGVLKEPVTVVDAKNPTAPATKALRVRYKYTDRALVPVAMARRSAVSIALRSPRSDALRVVDGERGNTYKATTKIVVTAK